VQVGRHPYFRREGLDLLVDVPVTIAEATFGATVSVPLLKGSVEIKVPAGAASGQKLRVKGQGLTSAKGGAGDFHAVVQIVAEKDLSPRGRELLEELAAELKNPRKSAPWSADSG
jgi:DnaJ-class molecular chaperone